MTQTQVVGKSLPRLDAVAKVTGTAIYAVDFALPGMLHGKILRSTQPHALMRRLDVSRARQLPGVRACSAPDVPLVRYGGMVQDETVLAAERVRYAGQPVAAVAADRADIAEEALALIEVGMSPCPSLLMPRRRWHPTHRSSIRTGRATVRRAMCGAMATCARAVWCTRAMSIPPWRRPTMYSKTALRRRFNIRATSNRGRPWRIWQWMAT